MILTIEDLRSLIFPEKNLDSVIIETEGKSGKSAVGLSEML